MPVKAERSPDAKGRRRLRGWRRSVSMSSRSLTMYADEAVSEKQQKAARPMIRLLVLKA